MEILILFIVLFALLSISVPVGLCIGGSTIAAIMLFTDLDLTVLAHYSTTGIDSFPMMAIPLIVRQHLSEPLSEASEQL